MIGHEYLNTPGPTYIPAAVLNAMHRQPLDLIDERLHDLARSCFDDMQKVFHTRGRIFFYSGNGHGGWEAALTNLCVPGDTVLVVEIGHFSHTWAEHARALGIHTETIVGDWREAVAADRIEARLREDDAHRIKAVLVTHVDTGTGIAANIPDVRAALDAAGHPALLVVDAVASLAALPLEMDRWGVDVAITASQKALMCPPGLAIVAANERACDVSRALPRHQRYWDWNARSADETYTNFGGTMPIHHMYGLRAALDIIFERGLETIYADHRRIAGAVHAALSVWSEGGALSFNALVPAQRAVTVTTIRTGPGMDADAFRAHARQQLGLSVAGGLGALAGRALRIGHMGALNDAMMLGTLATFDLALIECGVPRGSHAVQAAIDYLAQARKSVPQDRPLSAQAAS